MLHRRGMCTRLGQPVMNKVVTHPSTNTWHSLAVLFGWEAVLSTQYGQIHYDTNL